MIMSGLPAFKPDRRNKKSTSYCHASAQSALTATFFLSPSKVLQIPVQKGNIYLTACWISIAFVQLAVVSLHFYMELEHNFFIAVAMTIYGLLATGKPARLDCLLSEYKSKFSIGAITHRPASLRFLQHEHPAWHRYDVMYQYWRKA